MLSNTFLALSLLPLTLAHFNFNFPRARGFDEDKEGNFPCGGYDQVSDQRTDFPISGGPIQLVLGHPQTNVAVYMAVGDNPGSGFSIVLKQQLMVEGLGNFCLGSVSIPKDLNVTAGTKASIQVVTNAHSSGGLFQCADVTLVDKQLSQSEFQDNCKNNTGVKVTQENISGNPNSTATGAGGSDDGDDDDKPTASSSGSGSAASPTAASAATHVQAISWVLGAIGLAGIAML
ncbi:hypothetical protein COCMIDRAFT_922 [Bipolaris oryzae ATCC 44560]|uniref:Copper acquisition factor BIM1-like domain-containing protein n=1 Tax=Bipolaris oryzae ATCC 44560 TaxID=930090 RepID=W6ZF67_COCMI|nr:uncharacterized protein COCMIDRAFT_922 [Bipolaris oryzae ATCC 44560]EUC50472.1 hypothetical protein COCMIDRAFT_922 [Bipolaris oryzae ATCC 44560]